MAPKLVIGLTGTIGSGKDVVAEYLKEKHGFQIIGMGDLVREATQEKGLGLGRGNEQKVSKEFTDRHGMQYWTEKVVERIYKLGWEKVVINGIRRVQDYAVPKQKFGDIFHFILVDADPKIRFQRMSSRNRPGDPKTFEEFSKQERSEINLYGTFEECIKLADYTILNETTLDAVYNQVEDILSKIESN